MSNHPEHDALIARLLAPAPGDDLTAAHAHLVGEAARSSPLLLRQLAAAHRDGNLDRIRVVAGEDADAMAHYELESRTISLAASQLELPRALLEQAHLRPDLAQLPADRIRTAHHDFVVFNLGHESFHALRAPRLDAWLDHFNSSTCAAFGKAEGSPTGPDLTPAVQMYMARMMEHEAEAEQRGWNTLASRIKAEGRAVPADLYDAIVQHVAQPEASTGGQRPHPAWDLNATLRQRAAMLSACAREGADVEIPLARPAAAPPLAANGMVDPDQSRTFAKCTDVPREAYANAYIHHLMPLIGAAAHPDPDTAPRSFRLDLTALGIDPDRLRLGGADLGAAGRYLLLQNGAHGLVVVDHFAPEADARRNAPGARQDAGDACRANAPQAVAPHPAPRAGVDSSLSGELQHALGSMLPPGAVVSDARLRQLTSTAASAGIQAGDPLHLVVDAAGITVRGRHPSHVARLDLAAPPALHAPATAGDAEAGALARPAATPPPALA
ncbi:hypothetical protein [Pseudoxanthomonas koreensis]|uniref:hypothetical protein n=1 Tax=Pseudoxanthomonas koreensis TaxID=266061 RepID=UPI0035A58824